jgi:hypothetical protein
MHKAQKRKILDCIDSILQVLTCSVVALLIYFVALIAYADENSPGAATLLWLLR